MAAFLTSLAFLALGVAIGWFIKRRWFAPVYAESETERRAREWCTHAEAHAKAQKGSVVWTAPDVILEAERPLRPWWKPDPDIGSLH